MFGLKRRRRDGDFERELRDHLDLEAADQEENGAAPEEARFAARRAFGNPTLVTEDVRAALGWMALETSFKDLKYCLRLLRKDMGFTALAVLTLTLGIGADTALFSLMDAVLLRPLPYRQPDRLVRIWQSEPKMSEARLGTAPPEFAAYRDRTRTFSSVAGYQDDSFDVTANDQHSEHIPACRVSASLFSTLDVAPLLGRVFTRREELAGSAPVALLSYPYWKRRYAEDARVVGSMIRLNDRAYQIAGVMPRGFSFPSTSATPGAPPDVWVPLTFTSGQLQDWASSFDTGIVARLKDGVSLPQADDDICGFAPAWLARNTDVNEARKENARQSGPGRSQRRVTRIFIVAQIACSVVLLTGSGLLLRSFLRALAAPPGFDSEHVLIVRTTFNRQHYASAAKRHQTERAIAQRLALPGVAAVAVTTHVPLSDERQIGFAVDGRPPEEMHWADNALVSGDYFRVMGIPLLKGRTFLQVDAAGVPMVAVINQTMAHQYWPHANPIGQRLKWGGRHLTVIGAVGDIHIEALDKAAGPQIYNSVYQIESGASTSGVFVIRLKGAEDPMTFAPAARNAIWAVEGTLPILGFDTLHHVVSQSLAMRRAALYLICSFALLATFLSLVGIYGMLTKTVVYRRQETGLRAAIGASRGQILKLFLMDGIRLAISGIAIGFVVSVLLSALLTRLLFGAGVLDPASYGGGALLILAIALLASFLPAFRASRMDPMLALKHE